MDRFRDDELIQFEAIGVPTPLPSSNQGFVARDEASIWYATFGTGRPVILLHGGLGNSLNWGYVWPALADAGYQVVLIDTRGHGRSGGGTPPMHYESMAHDVQAVMQVLRIDRASMVGWSDGAVVALILASIAPDMVEQVVYFGCNMDPSGTHPFEFTPVIGRCLNRHQADYKAISPTPDRFNGLMEVVSTMQAKEPHWTADDLGRVQTPVTILQAEHDEFIKREHALYLSEALPNGAYVELAGVSHFAPVQRPETFNTAVLTVLGD